MAIVTICCKNCAKDFFVKFKHRNRIFCSKSCASIFNKTGYTMRQSQGVTEKIKETIKKKRILRNCLCCKSSFTTSKSRDLKYCSRKCYKSDKDKQYGFKGRTLFDIWIEKYGPIEAEELRLLKNGMLSLIHKETCSKMSVNEKKKRFAFLSTKNGMFGKNMLDLLKKKYGDDKGTKIYEESIKKGFETKKRNGTNKCSDAKRIQLRISTIKRIEKIIKGKLSPRYNPSACIFIDDFGKRNNFNFIHAENGGEFYVKGVGCYLDGYDHDNNIVIEFYERFHYNFKGELKQKDLNREKDIINHLQCRFIRVNAFDKTNIKLEYIN